MQQRIKLAIGRRNEYYNKIKKILAHPYYSTIIILGVPLRFTLAWGFYENGTSYFRSFLEYSIFWDRLLIFIIIIGPVATLIYYAHCSGNKLSSSLFGFLLYPLMLIYGNSIQLFLSIYPCNHNGFFELPFIFSTIQEVIPFSILHASIGFVTAFQKKSYLTIAIMLFVLHIAAFIPYAQ